MGQLLVNGSRRSSGAEIVSTILTWKIIYTVQNLLHSSCINSRDYFSLI